MLRVHTAPFLPDGTVSAADVRTPTITLAIAPRSLLGDVAWFLSRLFWRVLVIPFCAGLAAGLLGFGLWGFAKAVVFVAVSR